MLRAIVNSMFDRFYKSPQVGSRADENFDNETKGVNGKLKYP